MSNLTVRGVKNRLSRAGVDYSALCISQQQLTSRQVDIDFSGPWRHRSVVTITGPRAARRAAGDVLYDAGFACSPCGGVDTWMS